MALVVCLLGNREFKQLLRPKTKGLITENNTLHVNMHQTGTEELLWKLWGWQLTQSGGAKSTFFLSYSIIFKSGRTIAPPAPPSPRSLSNWSAGHRRMWNYYVLINDLGFSGVRKHRYTNCPVIFLFYNQGLQFSRFAFLHRRNNKEEWVANEINKSWNVHVFEVYTCVSFENIQRKIEKRIYKCLLIFIYFRDCYMLWFICCSLQY